MQKFIEGGVCAPKGFKAAGVHCGLKRKNPDLAMIVSDNICNTAAVYTTNIVRSATITVSKTNLINGKAKAVICNSGNANACNDQAETNAIYMCKIAAEIANTTSDNIIVASTGVIGQVLDVKKIANAKQSLTDALNYNGSNSAAKAIMTTDITLKECAIELTIGGKTCKIGAMAKGSGMIHPNMATMLCFITTDVNIDSQALNKAIHHASDLSFNMISVDGDTSTNDMVSIMANGKAENEVIDQTSSEFGVFQTALSIICLTMAKEIAKDGEGATKLIECLVQKAGTLDKARNIAKTVIRSSLVKTAMFGSDANWGRVLCAMGYSGEEFIIEKVNISFESDNGEVLVCKNGQGREFNEPIAKRILQSKEITIKIDMQDGIHTAAAYGCDLSYEYVRINGDYRT